MRDVNESIALIDQIVGRCVREPEFARAVIADPLAALACYGLNAGEQADFLALREKLGASALETWAGLRDSLFGDTERSGG